MSVPLTFTESRAQFIPLNEEFVSSSEEAFRKVAIHTVNLQTYCEQVSHQPSPDLNQLGRETRETLKNVPSHLEQAKEHAREYLDEIRGSMIQVVADFGDYASSEVFDQIIEQTNRWEEHENEKSDLSLSAEDSKSAKIHAKAAQTVTFLQIDALRQDIQAKKKTIPPTSKKFTVFQNHIISDQIKFEQDAKLAISQATELRLKEFQEFERQLQDLAATRSKYMFEMVASGLIGLAGGIMIGVGAGAAIPTQGASLALSATGAGVLAVGVTGVAVTAKLWHDEQKKHKLLLEEHPHVDAEVRFLMGLGIELKTLADSAQYAIADLQKLMKVWEEIEDKLKTIIGWIEQPGKQDSPFLVRSFIETSKTQWKQIRSLSQHLKFKLMHVGTQDVSEITDNTFYEFEAIVYDKGKKVNKSIYLVKDKTFINDDDKFYLYQPELYEIQAYARSVQYLPTEFEEVGLKAHQLNPEVRKVVQDILNTYEEIQEYVGENWDPMLNEIVSVAANVTDYSQKATNYFPEMKKCLDEIEAINDLLQNDPDLKEAIAKRKRKFFNYASKLQKDAIEAAEHAKQVEAKIDDFWKQTEKHKNQLIKHRDALERAIEESNNILQKEIDDLQKQLNNIITQINKAKARIIDAEILLNYRPYYVWIPIIGWIIGGYVGYKAYQKIDQARREIGRLLKEQERIDLELIEKKQKWELQKPLKRIQVTVGGVLEGMERVTKAIQKVSRDWHAIASDLKMLKEIINDEIFADGKPDFLLVTSAINAAITEWKVIGEKSEEYRAKARAEFITDDKVRDEILAA